MFSGIFFVYLHRKPLGKHKWTIKVSTRLSVSAKPQVKTRLRKHIGPGLSNGTRTGGLMEPRKRKKPPRIISRT